jgi:SOS-response transcriptional repressor LexA
MEILNPLTGKQKKVFDYIKSYFSINMHYPTYKEIQNFMNYKSPNAVTTIIQALIKKGYLYIDKNQSRRKIRLTNLAHKIEIDFNLKQINLDF